MFNMKRRDTMIGTVEDTYGVNLNARRDMLLGNLLDERGFESLTQLLNAYRGRLNFHPARRRLFLSFAFEEDRQQVNGFRLMASNPGLALDFSDLSVRTPINSEQSAYLKQVIQGKIQGASVVVCLIGNTTASREWVDWELKTARQLRKGLCGIRLKGSRGRTPTRLVGYPIARWDMEEITKVIECAAARRS